VLAEGAHADHHASVAAAKRAALVHPEYSSLRRVVPTAAAIAMATASASHVNFPKKTSGPAIHKDVTELAIELQGNNPPKPPGT
jgi:stearoyl-CoA desaturase (delta-9 desaturase)